MAQIIKIDLISEFLNKVRKAHATGLAREHSYRSLFEELFQNLGENISTVNDGKRIECGAPDICVLRDNLPIGYLECKDIDVNLEAMKEQDLEQLDQYKSALPNLILTNCLEWHYYKEGQKVSSIRIGKLDRKVESIPENFEEITFILSEFMNHKPVLITEPDELAKRMAGKARLIKEVFQKSLKLNKSDGNELTGLYKYFQNNLISNITIEEFSGISAETITYGMFVAWLKDQNPDSFNRGNSLLLIPNSNQFLRNFFYFIAGPNLDSHLAWIIDDLIEIFKVSGKVHKKMETENFGKLTGLNDPFIHFYETFLQAYNPKERKERGVWYTPESIVKFIVDAVDQVLQSEFELTNGLANESTVSKNYETGVKEQTKAKKPHVILKKFFRVQVLDPCTGTGTFLAEVVRKIASKVKSSASPSQWSNYVEENLMHRLHGFELLMAPYAMCHVKLDMVLEELDYKPKNPSGFSILLTNSLEEGAQVDQTLPFDHHWIVREAREANSVKRDLPIMCVIGNPPYLGRAGKATGWINGLLDDYRKEPGGLTDLNDSTQFANDLYVRFFRLASHYIEKNNEGIIGFITNHSYLDSITFRGMRWHLLKTFDKIWILDLHGNVMRNEVSDNEERDENVFQIQQGVAIIIAVKNNKNENELADLFHADLFGSREKKYNWLKNGKIDDPLFEKIETNEPYYPFMKWNYSEFDEYSNGIPLNELMPDNAMGVKTNRDEFTIDEDPEKLWNRMQKFVELDPEDARKTFNLRSDGKTWKVLSAQNDVKNNLDYKKIVEITYRPFDNRWTLYTGTNIGIHCFPGKSVMYNFLKDRENVGLVFSKQVGNEEGPPVNVFVTNKIFDCRGVYTNKGGSQVAPLYTYLPNDHLMENCVTNFEPELLKKICKQVQKSSRGEPDELAVFDYIYGTLYDKSYLKKYDRFLRMDFPKIPCPNDATEFWKMSDKGRKLRLIHLSTAETKESSNFNLAGEGDNIIGVCKFEDNKIWINKSQYFENVSEEIWNMYIGGYQPAKKWLKDRKGRELEFIKGYRHYQNILEILAETITIMNDE